MRKPLHALLLACAAPAALATCRNAPTPDARPNVVFLLVDDLGWADIGYNNPAVYSPAIDALAAESLRLTQHYVMPQCTPTRVALMTGRYPSRFGKHALVASNAAAFPKGTPTLAELFRAHGYSTHLSGKWHLGASTSHGPNDFGFDTSYGSMAGAVGMYDHRYRKGKFEQTWHRDQTILPDHAKGKHATDLVTDEAVRVIDAAGDRPFFLYVPFQSVHTPLDERGRFVERATQLDPEDPTRWLDEDEIEFFHDPKGIIQSEKDPEKRLFLAAVQHLDAAVARIVAALEKRGLRENTIVVFASDNGPQVNWPGKAYPDDLKLTDFNQELPMRGKKVDVWEGGIHVPAFVSWPARGVRGSYDEAMHIVDWFPSFAAMLDAQGPAPQAKAIAWDGVDLSPELFRGAEPQRPERSFYWTWGAPNRWAVRRGSWKIVRYGKRAPEKPEDWKLFDLRADPREARDLAREEADVLASMHAEYLRLRASDAPIPPPRRRRR